MPTPQNPDTEWLPPLEGQALVDAFADALAIAISYVFSLKRDKKGPVLASFPQIPPSKLRRVAVAAVATFGAVPAGRQGNRAAYLIPDKRIRG